MKRSEINGAADFLRRDGFEVERIEYTHSHVKMHLKKGGRRFWVTVSSTPSCNRKRWVRNIVQNARQALREGQGQPA